ncbi:MAG: hypothetical protein A2087_03340 [Spirochaetes bacterium GWD1_61_31]|nr:MAG: hypothetical protein A2Y37_05430 [Spirochaetes bacterium GWB1_60_80]OHD34449.1 MAG: hypothetical protein A2004_10570 [Spirochaetes bacterium GWC1_61_12]OHD38618.1 MAG: hypothetical protein A2087_03340 [Spirochaetes bacterium GWD1_61_31]OHD43164.1 MAG: hypothetical protein A2Y35_01235 [Spirochaetes bacterium GWE1_60_18]OHD58739.1 MAG: hypothetical protein A2Y32_01720 [Spirochaetes bacterium GWF1_60_12]HAP43483.1 hypothetical protein [Spirochaetaceae bacterium]
MERRLSEPRPEYLILGLLKAGPDYGYRLHLAFERYLGKVWHISQSQFYAMLKRLSVKGWVEASADKASGRQVFALAAEGERRLALWLSADSVSSARIIRLEFISRLFFAEFLGDPPARNMIDGQIGTVRSEVANLRRLLDQLGDGEHYNALGLEFRLSQLAALEAWLGTLRSRILSK